MKLYLMLILSLSTKAISSDMDVWDSTEYIYLAKPIYIFKAETQVEKLGGELGNSLHDLIIKIHEKQASKNIVYYYFEILEVIYGKEKNIFSLEFPFAPEFETCSQSKSFNGHTDKQFWQKDVGRSFVSKNQRKINICFGTNRNKNVKEIDACFELDKQYLIIGNKYLNVKQFELIQGTNDKWLEFVRGKAKKIKL